ncbi:hypothetical protein ACOAKG_27080 [Streptomyces sp. JL3001]|uniref:hypothetical protein n=1 Tax=Streptomyces sp. JL3001 TaxID=3400923 RepID=UPI003B27BF5D
MASVTAVGVAAIGGWLQQGGISLIQSIFSDEGSPSPPTVAVSASDWATCNTWLIPGDVHPVFNTLKREIAYQQRNPDEIEKVAKDTLAETGAKVPTGESIEVTVQGKENKAVVLTGLEVVVESKEALTGTTMYFPMQCGAGVPLRSFSVNLDSHKPKLTLMQPLDPEQKPVNFPYRVSADEPEVLQLVSDSKGYVEWKAKLLWVTDGKKGFTEIADDGKPFVTFPGGGNSETQPDYTFHPFELQLTPGRG